MSNEITTQKGTLHIGLTGHRPNKLAGYDIDIPSYQALQQDLASYPYHLLAEYQTLVCHSGLALGADTVWSKAILQMRELYPSRVKFHAEIPMMEQPAQWFMKSDVDFWHKQVESADFQTVYGSLADTPDSQRRGYAAHLLNDRNEGMVNHSDIMIAIHDGSAGGTGNARTYAEQQGKDILVVNPKNYFA